MKPCGCRTWRGGSRDRRGRATRSSADSWRGRLAGAGLATCARFGTLVAGLKVEKPGPLHGLPQRPEIVARAGELGWDDVLRTLNVLEAGSGGPDSGRNASEVTG